MTDNSNLPDNDIELIDFAHLALSTLSIGVPIILIETINALADKINVKQSVITRGALVLMLNAFTISLEEGKVYASQEARDALEKGYSVQTSFPDNFEHLVINLFPDTDNQPNED